MTRSPAAIERNVIKRELTSALLFYKEHPQSAVELLNFGQPELRQVDQPSEVAAGTIIASMLLNLDEAITHE